MPRRPASSFLCVLAAASLMASLGGASSRAAAADAPRWRWDYRVTVSPDLSALHVRLALGDFAPRRVWLADGGPLTSVRCDPACRDLLAPDPSQDATLLVTGPLPGGVLAYDVDLASLVTRRLAERVGRSLLTRSGSWMLRPGQIPPGLETTVSFDLPEGVGVAAPWERTGPASYRADASTWPFLGHVAFGALVVDRFEAGGVPVEVARLDGPLRATREGLRRWIGKAVEADAGLFGGRLPSGRLLAIVRPVRGQDVEFGSAWYGGGPHVVLYLGQDAPEDRLPGEWVSVHEILHTTLPCIAQTDAWLGEGFVTYYQEVLRARAGILSPSEAWSAIESGLRRGRASDSRRPIAQESREMHAHHEYYRVYWAGAAVALRLDADLRRASGGRRSLDDVMAWMRDTPGAGERPLTAQEVVDAVDRRLGEPRFSRIAGPVLASGDFPSVADVYAWLGLRVEEHGVALVPGAPGAAARDAIMAPAPPRASTQAAAR